MSLKELIRRAISLSKMKAQSMEHLADTILDGIEQYGFDLDEWREDTDIKEWIVNLITETQGLPVDTQAIGVIYILENEGFSLLGNGWLDDDPETIAILSKMYLIEGEHSPLHLLKNTTMH